MLITSLALALQAVPVQDANSLDFDVQCLSAISAARQNGGPAEKLMPISTFYMGRLDARGVSDADLRTATQRVTPKLEGSEVQPILAACAAELQETGQRLQNLGGGAAQAPVGR
jgi:hypothetical protein